MTTKRTQPVGVYIELDRASWDRLVALARQAHSTPVRMATALMTRWLASAEQSGMVRTAGKHTDRAARRRAQ